ncbi:DUF3800 domain-containing protein [Sinomonas soli]
MHIAYLDEFGHIGPYVSKSDRKYGTHPVFGFAGIVLPADRVREFGSFFFNLKNNLLQWELNQSGVHPNRWEKKGSALLTTKNIGTYPQVRSAMNRIFNKLESLDGRVFFYGQLKPKGGPEIITETSRSRYDNAMIQTMIRASDSLDRAESLMIILDEVDDKSRLEALASAGGFIFSDPRGKRIIEPPLQVESHLYQIVQAADWICALLGRLSAYWFDPEWNEFEWAHKYFTERLAIVTMRKSKLRNCDDEMGSVTFGTLRGAVQFPPIG